MVRVNESGGGFMYIECQYYEGYLLDDGRSIYDLASEEKRYLDEGLYYINWGKSIRHTALNMGISKSQLHRDLHNLKKISFELYSVVRRKLQSNRVK